MAHLLHEITRFCEKHEMAESRFGELALNDKPFVKQLRGGRRVWPATEDRIRKFMADHEASLAAASP
jgi:aspartate carbamoyltransferase catalytic subunit